MLKFDKVLVAIVLVWGFVVSGAVHAAKPVGEAIVYKRVGDAQLTLYVNKPEGWKADDRWPAIVFFHGGGWVGGSPGQFTEHSKYLAGRGMVCVQVQYRLLDGKAKQPPIKCTEDAVDGFRWVRIHAAKLGIDSNRIASGGGSAGGHLAAYLGTIAARQSTDERTSARPNAMVLFNPVYDNGPDGWGQQRLGKQYLDFSPMHNISKQTPPCIVFLGSEDKLIPVSTAEKFQQKMQEVGVKSELRVYQGQGHGFFNHGKDGNKWYEKTIAETDAFLTELGWLAKQS